MKILRSLVNVASFATFSFAAFFTAIPALAQHVSEDAIRTHITVLASDDFAGRLPGTEGQTKTLDYIAQQWSEAGLVSGTNDPAHPWFAPVALIQRTPYAQSVNFMRGKRPLKLPEEISIRSGESQAFARQAPTIYVGYGVDAQGQVAADVLNKVVLMESDDPPYAGTDALHLSERRAKLVDAGAAAVITIFSDDRDWSQLKAGFERRTIALASKDDDLPLSGAASRLFTRALFKAAGKNWNAVNDAAQAARFAGMDLPVTATLQTSAALYRFSSYNVIAKLPGTKPDSGAVLLLGHWDHLGICRGEVAQDRICNGAVDNASGIAVLIEAAKGLAAGPPLDRDIYFMATTAEEQGLLGAYAYADDPNIPLEEIVIALNVDTVAIAPRGAKVAIIGRGKTSLDPIVDAIARQLGRGIDSDTEANSLIRRQDGWALAAKGVPALMVGGSFSDMNLLESFLSGPYHGPEDEVNDTLELGGAAQDAELHIALARYFADTSKYTPEEAADEKAAYFRDDGATGMVPSG